MSACWCAGVLFLVLSACACVDALPENPLCLLSHNHDAGGARHAACAGGRVHRTQPGACDGTPSAAQRRARVRRRAAHRSVIGAARCARRSGSGGERRPPCATPFARSHVSVSSLFSFSLCFSFLLFPSLFISISLLTISLSPLSLSLMLPTVLTFNCAWFASL